jgi:hypothetical protein
VPDLVEDLTEAERKLFLANLDADESVRESVQAIVAASDQTQNQGSRSIGTPATNPELLSPDVLAQIRAEADGLDRKGARSAFATTYIAKKALTVLAKVVRRFVVKRDHGIYPTIVEELLRELYLANVGTRVWTAMKQQTQDAFAVGEPAGAGAYFAQQLAARVRAGARPRVTLIGHSTGAVYINNLLAYLQQLRSAGQLPADFAIENVVFLAPACTFEDFGRLLEPQFFGPEHALCRRLRIYAMSDSAECADALVPGVYTRSLLYFVSGVLETSAEGAAAVDAPLVGMHRYYTLSSIYTDSAVRRLRELLTTDSMRAVWSPTQSAEAGLMSSAVRHGDFDNDEPTLESLKYLIAEGNA